jgi:membrane-associated protease RseP (regulator of RpoE activity)
MDRAGMNGSRNTGKNRLAYIGGIAALALVAHGSLASAQAGAGGGQPQRVLVTTKDSTKRSEFVLMGTPTPRVDSLIQRLDRLPIGSAEYVATHDSLLGALRAGMPKTLAAQGQFTITTQVGPRAALRVTAMDVIPTGWFGFSTDGLHQGWEEPRGSFLRYLEYPTIVAIEANSPASRAGMRSGDSLLAYDGVDLRRNEINLTRLLVPGREISVKLRREGEAKDVTIMVEKAPPAIMAERRAAAAGSMVAAQRAPFPADTLERRLIEMRMAENQAAAAAVSPGRPGSVVATRVPPRSAAGGSVAPAQAVMGGPIGVLGAGMTNVDADMAESIVGMKGKRGVFVTTVPTGSIAERTGLKSGDVILRVESADVFSVAQLRARLVYAQMNNVEKIRVTILRKGKTDDLVYDPR